MAAMAAIPSSRAALETYLGFLESSDSTTEKDLLVTPHIDRVLQQRVKGGRSREETAKVEEGGPSTSSVTCSERGGYESRLMQLERQLSQLLQRNKTARKRASGTRQPHPLDGSLSTSEESSDEQTAPPRVTSRAHSVPIKDQSTTVKSSIATSHTASGGGGKGRRGGAVKSRLTEKENVSSLQGYGDGGVQRRQAGVRVVGERGRRGGEGGRGERGGEDGRGEREKSKMTTVQEDCEVKTRLAMETRKEKNSSRNGKTLAQELEEERQRRNKAEMAAGRLVEHVRSLQAQLEETTRGRELAVARSAKLDVEVKKERERIATLEGEIQKVQELLEAARSEVEVVRGKVREQENAMRAMEEEEKKKAASHAAERTELLGRIREAELTSAGHQRETEVAQLTVAELRRQLQQIQELLATRERDHQIALQNCKPLDGREVQEMIKNEVERERERAEAAVEQHKQRLTEQQKAYQALEDEFRMGLRIEASRYQELRECYDSVQGQVEGYRMAAEAALRKEQRATHMVAELTAIVREQKGRLAELGRAKQDSVQELKERVCELETEAREKHRLEVKVQSLQEDNSKLSSQLSAQESVLEGLREERQLWGRELAQQGAELAQDRGRMEAQIESLSNETTTLRSELQHARDSVRVKDKVVADQQGTISKLREALAAREREGEEARQDWEQEQQSLQMQLEQEMESSTHLQSELATVMERKSQLKEELSTVREELDQCQTKYSKLRGEWEERVKVIGSLEESLVQVQETFSQREAALNRDRDQATQRARVMEDRLRASEEEQHKRLEAQKASHDNHMTLLARQKDQEIEAANKKVSEVEGEMRELLVEVTKEKRAMEGRAQRMSLALQQLQQDFTSS